MGAGAELFEPVLQPGSAAGQVAGAVFEARAARLRGVRERCAVRSRCRAIVLTLSRSAARTRASSRCCCAIPRSDGSSRAAASSSSARRRARRRALFRRLGRSAWSSSSRARPALDAERWPPASRAEPAARRSRASLARAPPAAARSSAAASTPAPAPARSEPTPSSPLPLAARERPARSRRDRGRGAPQVGAERGEPLGAVGPVGGEPPAEPAQRPDGSLDRRRADHRPHARAGDETALRAGEQGEPGAAS